MVRFKEPKNMEYFENFSFINSFIFFHNFYFFFILDIKKLFIFFAFAASVFAEY